MDDALFIILMVIGAVALYWVLFGQKRYNNLMGYSGPSNVEFMKAQIKMKEYELKQKAKEQKKVKKKRS